MLEVKKINKEDIEEVSNLIAKFNHIEESHIGYCGTDKHEIANDMLEGISDVPYSDSFVGAYESNQLIGVLGFDADLKAGSAEVWGPFINADKWNLVSDMWEKMIELLPSEINSLEMFPNLKNNSVCQFAEDLSFEKRSDESILIFERNNSMEFKNAFFEELRPAYYSAMKELHDTAFPGAYYNGQQIIDRLNEQRKVFIITNEEEISGYIYVEAEPDFGEASIEFFAVEPSGRGKGTGSLLLTGALKWIFTFKSIDSITLCVNSKNKRAIKLYKKVGFQHLHDLYSFTKDIREK